MSQHPRHPTPVIRPASGADGPALERMFDRCSPETIRARFHGMLGSFPRPYIEDIVRGHPDVVAVVGVYDDDIVALASLQRDSRSTAELAILVEDAWQGDLGWRLAVALLGAPLVGCLANVKASILAGNSAALGSVRKAMRTTGVTATTRRDRETICVTMALSADDIPHSPTAANWQ